MTGRLRNVLANTKSEHNKQPVNLMAMMDEELDDKVRKKYYDEVQELIGQNIPILYLIAANSYAASQEGRIGNLWPSLLRPQMTWNLESLWKAQP